jgi:hypothetical protein
MLQTGRHLQRKECEGFQSVFQGAVGGTAWSKCGAVIPAIVLGSEDEGC